MTPEEDARWGSYDGIKETGHQPPDREISASAVAAPPAQTLVFDIPSAYYGVELLRDIAARRRHCRACLSTPKAPAVWCGVDESR